MSSILEALRKAERESGMPEAGKTPWPPPTGRRTGRRQLRRGWIALVAVSIVAGIAGTLLWQFWRPTPAPVAEKVRERPATPRITEKMPMPADTVVEQPPPPGPPLPGAVSPSPQAQPPAAPKSAAAPPTASPSPIAGAEPADAPPPAPVTSTRADRPAIEPAPPSGDSATADPPADTRPSQSAKRFRNDPRIDLQALVWAPEPRDRFVVINDRLVKEGGAIGDITLLKINPDDVLLTDGSDRWNERFTVR